MTSAFGHLNSRILKSVSNARAQNFATFYFARQPPTPPTSGQWPPPFTRFIDHTHNNAPVGRTPLGEWSARRRDLYLTVHNTHYRQTSTPLMGFEPTISAGERPQNCALDSAATGTGLLHAYGKRFFKIGEAGAMLQQISDWILPCWMNDF